MFFSTSDITDVIDEGQDKDGGILVLSCVKRYFESLCNGGVVPYILASRFAILVVVESKHVGTG